HPVEAGRTPRRRVGSRARGDVETGGGVNTGAPQPPEDEGERDGRDDRGDDTGGALPGHAARGRQEDRAGDPTDEHQGRPCPLHTTSRSRSRSSDSAATAAALSSGPIGWWPNFARSYSSVSVAATAV